MHLAAAGSRRAQAGLETIYGLLGDDFADAALFAHLLDRVLHIGAKVAAPANGAFRWCSADQEA